MTILPLVWTDKVSCTNRTVQGMEQLQLFAESGAER